MHLSVYTFVLCLTAVLAATTTSQTSGLSTSTQSSTSPTLVWVTGTDSNGVTKTTQSVFTQSFIEAYTAPTGAFPTGEIGLGAISGSVGSIRTYEVKTISHGSSKFTQLHTSSYKLTILVPLAFVLLGGLIVL